MSTTWGVDFPPAEQVFATYPWETVITSAVPLTLSLELHAVVPWPEPISLTLGDTQHAVTQTLLLTTATGTLVGDVYVYRWTRVVDDLRELPDGALDTRPFRTLPDDDKADRKLWLQRAQSRPRPQERNVVLLFRKAAHYDRHFCGSVYAELTADGGPDLFISAARAPFRMDRVWNDMNAAGGQPQADQLFLKRIADRQ
ncbi:MAG: hypothetical protein M1541_19330 [Acidobacteria bacterium]|nr:hypothetical protein [Acidobacteriota bacterium]